MTIRWTTLRLRENTNEAESERLWALGFHRHWHGWIPRDELYDALCHSGFENTISCLIQNDRKNFGVDLFDRTTSEMVFSSESLDDPIPALVDAVAWCLERGRSE